MPAKELEITLQKKINELNEKGIAKGSEKIITKVKKPEGKFGPRFFLENFGDREFIKMNSNSYLGMSLRQEIIDAEEEATKKYGTGPGAVRFISGTYQPHIELENLLAKFHNREAAMIFSSAYSTVMGVLSPLIDEETIVISDELNHNSIINAIKLARPQKKDIYKHLDMNQLEEKLKSYIGLGKRVLIITDGIFSMRGDNAPLDIISKLSDKYDKEFDEGILVIEDDSHGIGAFGKTGRGTEEYTGAKGVDIIIATLGKALGVNGGYVTSSSVIVNYLRETSPFYIYSNPITVSEACAAIEAVKILDSNKGIQLLEHLRKLTKRFEEGLQKNNYEIIHSEHPIVPLMVRDTKKTSSLVQFLMDNNILATGLNYPVVPKGDEEIRFQINADHTAEDIDYVISVLGKFKNK